MASNQTMIQVIAQKVVEAMKVATLPVSEIESTNEHIRTSQPMPRTSGQH